MDKERRGEDVTCSPIWDYGYFAGKKLIDTNDRQVTVIKKKTIFKSRMLPFQKQRKWHKLR
jgi:hypothetical protein